MASQRRMGALIGLGVLLALIAVPVSLAYDDPTPPYQQIEAKYTGGPYVKTLMLKPDWREGTTPSLPIVKPTVPVPGGQQPQSVPGKTLGGVNGGAMAIGSTGASDAVASPEARLEQSLKSLARSLR